MSSVTLDKSHSPPSAGFLFGRYMAKLLKHAKRWLPIAIGVATLVDKVVDIVSKLPW